MIHDSELLAYYSELEPTYDKALSDVKWQLEQFIRTEASEGVDQIYVSSIVTERVKPFDSVLRKARRDGVETVEEIPGAIEDLVGIRIATANKKQARELFSFLQETAENWFCESVEGPKFTPYTIEDKNNYSMRTGYQAFHVTFVHRRNYQPITPVDLWPVEIQILSQLWAFWANYSRVYFYTGTGSVESELLPYNSAISKILDSADDLMTATADLLSAEPSEEAASDERSQVEPDVEATRTWLIENLEDRFGRNVRMPNDVFVARIADDLAVYGVSLQRLSELLDDDVVRSRYEAILDVSGLGYLPPYQQILCFILLGLGWDSDRVVGRVNEALWPQGVRLAAPRPEGRQSSQTNDS
jgi:ppGpp synthetase/RelA/SpoT-type nucleotidyltranferase